MISYKHMSKQAISVTLEADNITWLKGRVGAGGLRSVSELLDQLVVTARQSGRVGSSKSVVGTIDIDPGDASLEEADTAVRSMFDASLRRPLIGSAIAAKYRTRRRGGAKQDRG
jgi:hypothetical protein